MKEPTTTPIKFMSLKQLYQAYGISKTTMSKELNKVPGLKKDRFQKIFNPKQVKIIFNHLGNPLSE